MKLRLYDAHNHLQDERLNSLRSEAMATAKQAGVVRMVVNGSCETDWPAVLDLARQHPEVIPSFGYHPWYVKERTSGWQKSLVRFLDATPSAVGEIGLDRWIENRDDRAQEDAFIWQLGLAKERNLPVSIHCLKAWGRMYMLLKLGPRPARGFLLHSYGGPVDMVRPLADVGAYFSLPGYYAHEPKARQRETFRQVPRDRFLIETDAPDQRLPDARNAHPCVDPATGKPLNHPANLLAVYQFASELLGESIELLAARVEQNFQRLFGNIARVEVDGQNEGPSRA